MICSLHSRARASGYRHEISTPNRGQARRPRRPPRISTAPAIRFGKRTKPIDRAAGCACRAHQNATRFERIRSQVVHPIVQRKSAKENSGSVLNPVCKSINPRHDWLIRSDRASPGRLGRPGARPRGPAQPGPSPSPPFIYKLWVASRCALAHPRWQAVSDAAAGPSAGSPFRTLGGFASPALQPNTPAKLLLSLELNSPVVLRSSLSFYASPKR